ncbi:MAG: LysR family transcriptional regulator [Alphaproteobacteria bacterium]
MSPDWDHLRVFVGVAEHGSLSAAGRELNISQPTVGRHIQALEDSLGVRLFQRTVRGLDLTDTGRDLLEHGREMAAAADRLALAAAGREAAVSGTVRVTASAFVATLTLPEIIADLRLAHPEIEIELVASDATENLLQREADIAVRMYRPRQVDVITRKVSELSLGVYAANSYLSRRGTPRELNDLLAHDIVGYDRDETILQGFAAVGVDVDRHFFVARCDDQVAYWHLVVAGVGIGFSQVRVGDAEPLVSRVLPDFAIPPLPVWLTAHAGLRTNPRVRRVFDFLAERLARPGGL